MSTTPQLSELGVRPASLSPCPACPDKHYRAGCNKPQAGWNGTCVPCPPCDDPDEVRVDCLSRAGNNDASGRCVRRDWVSRTAQCPVENTAGVESSVGLAGFSFKAIFGGAQESVDFACSTQATGFESGSTRATAPVRMPAARSRALRAGARTRSLPRRTCSRGLVSRDCEPRHRSSHSSSAHTTSTHTGAKEWIAVL